MKNNNVNKASKKAVKKVVTVRKQIRWTTQELEILRDNYILFGIDNFPFEVLQRRTPHAVKVKIKRLGLHKTCWTVKEMDILKEKYGECKLEELAKHLPDKKLTQICSQAKRLNLLHSKTNWTQDELDLLNFFYPTSSMKELLNLLPNRTENAIRRKAAKLGLKRDEMGKAQDEKDKQN